MTKFAKTGPLSHLVVVDATSGAPGSIATLLLADMGARVIKVERSDTVLADDSLLRTAWEGGKESIALDLADEADRQVMKGLLAKADIFLESFGRGGAGAIGLDFASLSRDNPALIMAAITGYGQDGPWKDEPGYDCLLAARFGIMMEQASVLRENGPIYLGHPHIAYGTGFVAAISILAAVRARRLTGRGQFLDVSLLDGLMAQQPMNHWWHPDGISYVEFKDGKRTGFGRKRLITAAFECQDGEWLQIHSGGQGGFRSVMDVFGFADVCQTFEGSDMSVPLNDEEFAIAREYIREAFLQRDRAEWIPEFEARDVACLPILRQGEVLKDPQVIHAKRAITVHNARHGKLLQAGPPLTFEKTVASPRGPAPRCNEDAEAIRAYAALPAQPRIPVVAPVKPKHALEGVRILDFSTFFATAYGSKQLSDLGADVIYVEQVGGDQLRPLPNPFEACHRGTRTISVNLKTPEGLAIIHELVKTADVVMHNQRPGKADKLGIGYSTLAALNPRLIYCYLPGFGGSGPRAMHKSFAPLQSGFTGLLYECAGDAGIPARRIEASEDYYNGLLGATAVLAGLEAREVTGEGQFIESPQLHSGLFVGSHHFLTEDGRSLTALPMDGQQYGLGPLYRLYETKNDWICIAAVGLNARERLLQALGLGDSAAQFPQSTCDDPASSKALADLLAKAFRGIDSEKAVELLRQHGIACVIPAKEPQQPRWFFDEWMVESGRVIEHLDSPFGHIREIGLHYHLSDTPGIVRGPAPLLGAHTVEILQALGYTQEQIEEWERRRVIGVLSA